VLLGTSITGYDLTKALEHVKGTSISTLTHDRMLAFYALHRHGGRSSMTRVRDHGLVLPRRTAETRKLYAKRSSHRLDCEDGKGGDMDITSTM